jgi:TonB-linked SusC/RagA family outer membrane protein
MRRVRYVVGALLAVIWIAPVRAQEPAGTVRGRVVEDATQQPLARVTVAVGARGALTQTDGSFIITSVPAGQGTLRVRMLGYAPVTRPVSVVANQTVVVDVAMTAQAISLAEIVVTGYGEQRAGDITGAVSQITPDEFNPGRIVTPALLVQSKVAGVQVVESNEPGGGTTIRIRGATSVNASSDPLYVVDGMPLGTGAGGGLSAGRDPLNFLNPNDIESITVLKDASAAAIYGSNAANGVVLITTKSATGGRRGTQVEYSSSFSASSVTRLPDMLTAAQFRTAVGTYAPGRSASLLSANTDWFSQIDRTAYGQEQNVSLTTAGESMYYRLSLGYLKQDGILRGTTTDRLSLGLNYDQHLLNHALDFKLNIKGSRTNDRFTPSDVLGNAVGMAPTQPVRDSTNATGYYDWNTTGASASNPVASLNLSTDHGTTWRSVGNVQADYRFPFLQALRANLNLGYDVTQADRQRFFPTNLASQQRQGHGYLSLSNNSQANSVLEAYLNYAAPLNVLPGNVDVTAGYSYAMSHAQYPFFQESNLGSNLLGDNGIPTATTVQNTKFVVDSKLISFFGRLNYNVADRYLLAVSVRRDGSSRFGPTHAWGTFPSVALAWRLSQEPFLRSYSSLFSDLKLRASWAKTGNQAFADYQQYATYTYSDNQTQYQFGNQFITTIRPSAVDPNIRWEATSSYNVGLDFGFRNQRFTGAIDWYTKKTSDLIFNVPVAAGTNFSNYLTTNIGGMENKGIEFSLNARVLEGRGNGLGWTATFTAGHNTNKLLSISQSVALVQTGFVSGGVGTRIQVFQPGYPINSFFVYEHKYKTTGCPSGQARCPIYSDTLLNMYVDRNNDGAINNSDLRPFHDPFPKWQLGHTSYLTYRKFDLSFTLRANLGNYVYNNVASSNGAYQGLTSGGSPSNLHASVLKSGFVVPQFLSDYYVEDASFLRMDNITLGYTFQYRGQPLRVYAAVQNVFTMTGYTGVDPTAGLNGLDNNIYPRSRTFTGGLSVRF